MNSTEKEQTKEILYILGLEHKHLERAKQQFERAIELTRKYGLWQSAGISELADDAELHARKVEGVIGFIKRESE